MAAKRKITANIARLNALMDEAGLDALVLRSGQNFTYLSGVVYPGTLARHLDLADSTRAVLLFWPRKGKPVILADKVAAGLAQRDSWVETVQIYDAYVESPYEKMTEVINDAGLSTGRVGLEKDYVSAAYWDVVRKAAAKLDIVDCTNLMDRVRWIKTEDEIRMLRRAADLLDDVYMDGFRRIKPGDTERKIHADMIATCLAKGFEWAHGILNSHKNTIPYAGESDFVINQGDVIRTDYVSYLRGYPGHQSRTAIVGTPTAEQRRDYAINLEVYRNTIDRCRAGAKADDLYQYAMGEYRKHGWPSSHILIGHGVGPWWHQQAPILRKGSAVHLEEGMVLALEPHVNFWHVQDMILVQKGAPTLLSAKFNTDEPFVVG